MGLLSAAVLGGFSSCDSSEDDAIQKHKLRLLLELPSDVDFEDIEDLRVTAKSSKGAEFSVNFQDDVTPFDTLLLSGSYVFDLTGKISETRFLVASETVELYNESNVKLKAEAQTKSSLIFKTIYHVSSGYYISDTYVEIVNNSDEVQYLDQLIVNYNGVCNQKGPNAWQANGLESTYASSQSLALAFPGEGTDYPLEPGKSVIVANTAAKHATAEKPQLPDLSNADFEIFNEQGLGGDTDNPNVPNMDIIWGGTYSGKSLFFGIAGGAAILSRPSKGMTAMEYGATPENIMTTPGTSSEMTYLVVQSADVLDAVHIVSADNATPYSYFLPVDDAAPTVASVGWSATCSRRKSEVVNGKEVFQDTNNSKNDFLPNQAL